MARTCSICGHPRVRDIDAALAARPETELEKRCLDWIARHDGAKKRHMQQTMSKYCSCEMFNKILLNLQRAGHIQIEDGKVYLSR